MRKIEWNEFEKRLFNQLENRIINDNQLFIQWHITNRCEENCMHCYLHEEEKSDFPKDKIGMLLDKIYDASILLKEPVYITLIGGDPILYPFFWEVLEQAKIRGFRIRISGNPNLITPNAARKLKRKGVLLYQLSLDGPKEINDKIRSKGHYERTIKAIQILQDAGIRISIKSVVHSLNIDSLPILLEEIARLGVKEYNFVRYVPFDQESKDLIQGISREKFKQFIISLFEMASFLQSSNIEVDILLREHLIVPLLYEKGILLKYMVERINTFNITTGQSIILDGCSMWDNFLVIDIKGNVFPCKKVPINLGSIFDEDILTLLSKKEKLLDVNSYEKCGRCILKSFCRGCPAVSLALTGNLYAADPHCWFSIQEVAK